MLETFGNVVYYIIYRKRFMAKCLKIHFAAPAAEYKNRRNVCTRRNLKLVLNAFRSRRGI